MCSGDDDRAVYCSFQKQPSVQCPEPPSTTTCFTESTDGKSSTRPAKGIESWRVEEVLAFFKQYNFPTEGIKAGEVDGKSLVNLYQDSDAESLFMAPAPDGLGFNKLMFKGRFKKEIDILMHSRAK